jgi:hypothetical protein
VLVLPENIPGPCRRSTQNFEHANHDVMVAILTLSIKSKLETGLGEFSERLNNTTLLIGYRKNFKKVA